MARELDLDHFVSLRDAPNGSARNKIEKAMSPLYPPLTHEEKNKELLHHEVYPYFGTESGGKSGYGKKLNEDYSASD